MNWHEERNFLVFQSLPIRSCKVLKRLSPEDRENAYLWIIYKINIPDAGFSFPEPGEEHHFPKFMYDELGTKPMQKVVVMYSPKRSADYFAKCRIFSWPPETRTPWVCHASSIHLACPNA